MWDSDDQESELADIDNSSGWLTGHQLTNPRICTASDTRPCHIFKELPSWNELLCTASMELKEERPGQLTLAYCFSLSVHTSQPDKSHCAATLAFWLLKEHRCVATFDINASFDNAVHAKLVASGLESSALKKLRISERIFQGEYTVIGPMLRCLTKLEELHWQCYAKYRGTCFPNSLCSLVETASSLSTLSIPNVKLKAKDGIRLLNALERSTNVKKLAINVTPFITSYKDQPFFKEYITQNKALTTLEMTGHFDKEAAYLKSAVSCVSLSESLLSVSFRNFVVDEGAAFAIEAYLNHNRTVLQFSLKECLWWFCSPSKCWKPSYQCSPSKCWKPSYRIDPWLSILRNSQSLERLQLSLIAFSVAECEAFLEGLATSRSLKEVIIDDLGAINSPRVQEICHTMSTATLISSFQDLPGANVVPVQSCRESFQINLISLDQPGAHSLHRKVPSMLPENVTTKLELEFLLCTEEVGSLVAQHIIGTKILTDLAVAFRFNELPASPQKWEFKKKILTSLLLNTSVKRLRFNVLSLTDGEATLLASVVKGCQHILEYSFFMDGDSFGSIVEQLLPDFAGNYNVLSIRREGTKTEHADHWFHVSEIVRRNVSLVSRAAAFVAGSRDRRNAEALELVASSPALEHKVCEELHVEKSEASLKVRQSVGSLQSVSDFMIASGVVMSTLRCHPRRDLRLQLTDLDEYCWLAIRKYLRVADVCCGE